MKILVTAKRVEDPESKIKVDAAGKGIVTDGLKYKINPFDELAIEESLRLVAKHGGEVVVVSIGTNAVHEQLRQVIAAGFSPPANFAVSKAIWVNHTGPLDPYGVASALKVIAEREKPDLVILGKQAIDDDQNQVGQYLAEWLNWSQATFASKEESFDSDAEKNKQPGLKLSDDKKSLRVVREVDGGLSILECTLPAIVTTDLRLCKEMRYSSLPGIMKAKTRPLEELTAAALGVDLTPKVTVVKMSSPPARKAGIKVPDVATLVTKLKTEAKVV